jgi:3-hydroxybenzoate 6-monooxygenase
MAIEDGLCPADCIAAANGDYEAAFGRYENARAMRTARLTLESRNIWDIYHLDGITRASSTQTARACRSKPLDDPLAMRRG